MPIEGTGKSIVMRYIKSKFNKNLVVISNIFKAWKYKNNNNLALFLLEQLLMILKYLNFILIMRIMWSNLTIVIPKYYIDFVSV
ncbi:MAG: hypothetical protein FH761_09010 [Firmicutes bacterium]|nr:hypothetical protein [Bacillota bacterium]